MQFARIDPAYARELFIRHALVEGEWELEHRPRSPPSTAPTARCASELEELEERTRRRDILFDDEAMFEFYDRRIPADVQHGEDLRDLVAQGARRDTRPAHDDGDEPRATSDRWSSSSRQRPTRTTGSRATRRLGLSYRFEPGAEDDGVTVRVPLALLARLSPAGFDWLVPGLREELVTALIKTLPKAIRRNVVPAADWARRLLDELPTTETEQLEQQGITEFLARTIQR